ncbi:tol-pal system protein YbgF [Pirellulimonas nuda]|uniref:Tol-pal system protein YbgF n=1 Tax=Pirellulimonas nuda TaxID=2528009 RepID=A0A518DAJ6_9BACT|nr:tetratricopeptide repeat protein [Pirellulimonas nuda]QDU88473.1 tol-pal system protein YbgF [Pirellulimonas nuda]
MLNVCYRIFLAAGLLVSAPVCAADFAGAIALQDRGLHDLAAKEWQAIIDADPDGPEVARARYNLAVCRFSLGAFDEAAGLFETVVDNSGDESLVEPALANLGLAYFNQSPGPTLNEPAMRAALESFDNLIRRFPKSKFVDQSRFYRGETLAALGQLGPAAEAFRGFLKSSPDGDLARRARLRLAATLVDAGEPQQALSAYDALLSSAGLDNASRGEALMGRGAARLALDQFLPAAQDFEAAAKLPGAPEADYALERQGFCLYRAEKFEEAAAAYKALVEKHAQSPLAADARLAAGKCCFLAERYGEAARWFSAAWKAAPWPDSAEAAHWHCQALLKEKRPDLALKQADAALATGPAADWKNKLLMDRADGLAGAEKTEATKVVAAYLAVADDAPQGALAPRALYLAATAAMSADQFAEAQRLADRLLKQFPNDPLAERAAEAAGAARLAAARKLITQGKNDEAAALLAGSDGAASPQKAMMVATALFGAGKHREALEALDGANADEPQALYLRGAALAALERPQDAASAFEKVIRNHPDSDVTQQAMYQRALLARAAGDDQLAVRLFERAAASKKSPVLAAEARYQLGDVAYTLGELDRAEAAFALAAEQAADADLKEQALHLLGWSRYRQEKFAPAAEAFTGQLALAPQGGLAADAKVMLGECRFGAKDYAAAIKAYREALGPGGSPRAELASLAALHAGQSAGQLGQWEESLSLLDEAQQRHGQSPQADEISYERAWALVKLGRSGEAMPVFQTLAEKNDAPLSARSKFMIGELQFAEKQYEPAVRTFFQVAYGYGAPQSPVEYQPWQAEALFEAARCLEQLERQQAADKLLGELVTRFPDHAKTREARAILAKRPQ